MPREPRVTLILVDQKLNDLIDLVKTHAQEDREQFYEFRKIIQGNGDGPGLKGKVDRLEQNEARRSGHIKALWVAVIAGAVSWAFSIFQAGAKP